MDEVEALAESVLDATPAEIRASFGVKPPAMHQSMESKYNAELESTFILTASRQFGLGADEIEGVRDAFLQTGGGTLTSREARELAADLVDRQILTDDAAARVIRWARNEGLIVDAFDGGA